MLIDCLPFLQIRALQNFADKTFLQTRVAIH